MNASNFALQRNGSVSILQFTTEFADTLSYVSISTALKNKYAEIKEINETGKVNNITLINDSEHYIFISDGDILIGAKQNRVLNTSVMIAPNSKTEIPVSCVESGRWRFNKRNFGDSDFNFPSNMRRNKSKDVMQSLRSEGKHYADQSRVWKEVNEYENSFEKKSNSSDLSELLGNMSKDVNDIMQNFSPVPASNGNAIFFGKNLITSEIFNRTDIYREYFPKLVKSSGIDFLKMPLKQEYLSEAEAIEITSGFLKKISGTVSESHKGVGAGTEKRFSTNEMTGLELLYNELPVHISVQFEIAENPRMYTDIRGRKIINFGKYKGMALIKVYRMDNQYVKWLCFDSDIDINLKKEIYNEVLKFGRI